MNDGEFNDYYIKLVNSRYQRTPDFQLVNMKNVVRVRVAVNFGLADYVGKVYLDELSFMNVSDVPEEVIKSLENR